jgi:peptidoglycan/LPS O-acetylase OafA/YrhL
MAYSSFSNTPETASELGRGNLLHENNDYRPDIDGLRAIAVLSVVIFHAFPALLQGGFVGVDLFFVISGYLISKHIWEELGTGTFSIKTFYARRVRRIFPALSLVLLACLLMGWIILTPGEYEQLGRHVIAGALFVSNIIFWQEAGYFDNAADTKPLLHLWSLGIEEQFYIAWPLLLALFWRYSKHLTWFFVGVLGISLTYSVMVVRHDVVADFYSPLTRFWELALGAGLAHSASRKSLANRLYPCVISWIGLFLVLCSITLIHKMYSFPGLWAILPTIGAACLIYAGNDAWLNRQVLSHRLLVWIGLISYPLYLWHWPLLSFARIIESGTPSITVRIFLIAASVALAWLTFQFLERPLRSKPRSKKIIWILCLAILFLGITGLIVKNSHGFKSRQFSMLNGESSTIVLGADREKLQHECGITGEQKSLFQSCLKGGAEEAHFALLGDSKAEALFYGLARESSSDGRWTMIGTVLPPEGELTSQDSLQLKNRLAFDVIANNSSIKVVALAIALRDIFPIDSNTGFVAANATPSAQKIASYSQAIQHMEQSGKRVLFIIDNPTFPDPTSCVNGGATSSPFLNQFLRRKENSYCTIRYTDHLAGTQVYRQFVNELKRLHPELTVYDPSPLLCDIPHNTCTITQGGKFLYSYSDHISDYANSMIARDMLPVVKSISR